MMTFDTPSPLQSKDAPLGIVPKIKCHFVASTVQLAQLWRSNCFKPVYTRLNSEYNVYYMHSTVY